jgi:hypothetical protein
MLFFKSPQSIRKNIHGNNYILYNAKMPELKASLDACGYSASM